MSLNDSMTSAVGFIYNEEDRPIGTAFLVRVGSELGPDEWTHDYLVTAAHVVPHDGETRTVRLRDSDGRVHRIVPQWTDHPRGGDIAVAPFALTGWQPWDLRFQSAEANNTEDTMPGSPVHYIGLLTAVPSLAQQVRPMVRTGYLGMRWATGVKYSGGPRHGQTAHLIECRSRGGFSGSPCFVKWEYPLQYRTQDLPPGLTVDLIRRGVPPHLVGINVSFATLWGVLAGYTDDDGVGAVLPVGLIRETLADDMLVDERREIDLARLPAT